MPETDVEEFHWAFVRATLYAEPGTMPRLVGPMNMPRYFVGTAWQTGYADPDACRAESRTDDGVQYLGLWRDDGLGQLDDIAREAAGEGVRWIMCTLWIMDHLLPECPAVRRHRRVARWGSGLLDPEGTDICGWCLRVWRARQAKELAA